MRVGTNAVCTPSIAKASAQYAAYPTKAPAPLRQVEAAEIPADICSQIVPRDGLNDRNSYASNPPTSRLRGDRRNLRHGTVKFQLHGVLVSKLRLPNRSLGAIDPMPQLKQDHGAMI